MEAALKKYANAPVTWSEDLPAGGEGKKLLVVGFDEARGDGLKILEDRTLVKYHQKCAFVRRPYEKGSEEAKRWGVTQAPTFILCDPSKETPEKTSLEKLAGKKSAPALKAALQKAPLKIEGRK